MESVFKEWKIQECIGEGAFGKVYKIVREEFGHTYEAALKVIEIPHNQAEYNSIKNETMDQTEVDDYFKSMIEDIIKEFTLMSKLKGNSNIVSYEDHAVVKKTDGYGWTIYIRMELLTSLFQHAKSVSMTNYDVLQLGIDVCKALEVCQNYHIIHRDIKPDNIFISDIGTYKLGDFGIARELEKTTAGLSKKGTKSYMAPEVYKGMEYNSTVDIYSLGIVLYRFMNDNRVPFVPLPPQPVKYADRERADIMRMSGQPMPAPARASKNFAEVILKACAYLPKDRYQNPTEMRMALERVKALGEAAETLFHGENAPKVQPRVGEETNSLLMNSMESSQADATNGQTQVEVSSSIAGADEHTVLLKQEEPKDAYVVFQEQEEASTVLLQQTDTEDEGTRYLFQPDYKMEKQPATFLTDHNRMEQQVPAEADVDEQALSELESIELDEAVTLEVDTKKKVQLAVGATLVCLLLVMIVVVLVAKEKGNENKKQNQSLTASPIATVTVEPTKEPTQEPTEKPTKKPTKAPTKKPTKKPTKEPTRKPVTPTKAPVVENVPVKTNAPVVTEAPVKKEEEDGANAFNGSNENSANDVLQGREE